MGKKKQIAGGWKSPEPDLQVIEYLSDRERLGRALPPMIAADMFVSDQEYREALPHLAEYFANVLNADAGEQGD